jgi:hypothetical protein
MGWPPQHRLIETSNAVVVGDLISDSPAVATTSATTSAAATATAAAVTVVAAATTSTASTATAVVAATTATESTTATTTTAAATTAVAAAATAAEATAATAAATAALLALLGLIDAERAAVERTAIHALDRLGGFFGSSHGHEREAAGAAGLAVRNQVDIAYCSEFLECSTDAFSIGIERKISNVQTSVHRLLDLAQKWRLFPPRGGRGCSKRGFKTKSTLRRTPTEHRTKTDELWQGEATPRGLRLPPGKSVESQLFGTTQVKRPKLT